MTPETPVYRDPDTGILYTMDLNLWGFWQWSGKGGEQGPEFSARLACEINFIYRAEGAGWVQVQS